MNITMDNTSGTSGQMTLALIGLSSDEAFRHTSGGGSGPTILEVELDRYGVRCQGPGLFLQIECMDLHQCQCSSKNYVTSQGFPRHASTLRASWGPSLTTTTFLSRYEQLRDGQANPTWHSAVDANESCL